MADRVDDTKRQRILDACRAEANETCGIAYFPSSQLPQLHPSVAKNAKEKTRDVYRNCVDFLEEQARNGERVSLLRLTEDGLKLSTGRWVTFVEETSELLNDIRLIASCVEELKFPGINPRWKRKVYLFEFYLLSYLIKREVYPRPLAELLNRARSFVDCRKIREFVRDAPQDMTSSLKQLPVAAREEPLEVLNSLKRAIENKEHQRGGEMRSTSDWIPLYTKQLLGIPLPNLFALETRLYSQNETSAVSGPSQINHGTPIRFLTAMEQERRIVVLGASGSGKSWLMKKAAKDWLSRNNGVVSASILPILVRLQDFNLTDNILDLISSSVCEYIGNEYSDEVRIWLDSPMAKADEVLLLLDGYNEILPPRRQRFNRLFQKFMGSRNNRVVITTRAYDSELLFPDWPRVYTTSISSNQIRQHLVDRLGDAGNSVYVQIATSPHLLSMAESPFFLEALVRYVRNCGTEDIPTSRAALIEAVIDMSLKRKLSYESVQFDTHPTQGELTTFLAALGHRMLALRDRQLVHPKDTKPLWTDGTTAVRKVLEFSETVGLLDSSGTALIGRSADQVRFAHDLLRDYFAAKHMYASLMNDEASFLKEFSSYYLEDMAWDETLLMFADLCVSETNCAQLIELLLRYDIFLGVEFVTRLIEVSPKTLARVARLAERLDPRVGFQRIQVSRMYDAVARLFAKLSDEQLQYLYHKLPKESDAWTRIVYAFSFKPGDLWRKLLPKHEGSLDKTPYSVLIALARVPSLNAFGEVIKLMQISLASMSRDERLLYQSAYSLFFREDTFVITPDQLLDALEAPANTDLVETLSLLLAMLEFSEEHLPRLKHLARSPNSAVSAGAVRAISRVQPVLAMQFVDRQNVKFFCASEFFDVLRAVVRSGEKDRAFAMVLELLDDNFVPRWHMNAASILEILCEIGTDEAGEVILRHLCATDMYIPPRLLAPFSSSVRFRDLLASHIGSPSEHVRARAMIGLGALGDETALAQLLPIIKVGFLNSAESELGVRITGVLYGLPDLDGPIDRDTALMALHTIVLRGYRKVAPDIWSLLLDENGSNTFVAQAIDALIKLKHTPVLEFLCCLDPDAAGNAWSSAAEVMSEASEEDCRDTLVKLRVAAEREMSQGNAKASLLITKIAQAILQRRGWRFTGLLDGWPLGSVTPYHGPLPTGYKELDALIEEYS